MRGTTVALVLCIVLAACGKNQSPPPPTSGRPGAQPESGPRQRHPDMNGGGTGAPVAAVAAGTPAEQARAMFGTTCVMCHGADGTGHGPAADTLDPKPRNYTDAAWQASVTDDQIKQILLKGGKGVGKSIMMPAHPELESQPALLDAMVQLIRDFGKK